MTDATVRIEERPGVSIRRMASKFALCLMYTLFIYAHVQSLRIDGFRLSVALLAVFESIVVALVFLRRDFIDVDRSFAAVAAGLLGTFMVLLMRPADGGQDLLVGQAVQMFGAVLQLGASVSLGRSFGLLPANRGIKTGGMYRLVRHPLYFSYLVTQTGYLINNPSGRNLVVAAVGTVFQVMRIRYEERLLARVDSWVAYSQTVRWRLMPGVW